MLRTVASGLRGVGGASSNPRGGGWVAPLYSKALLLSLAANQLVTMQDLKQGLGPSGAAGTRKSASNKYKLKVGAWTPGRAGCSKHGRAQPQPGRRLSAPGPPSQNFRGIEAAFLHTCSGFGLSAPPGCRDQLTPVAQGGVSSTACPRGRLPLTCPVSPLFPRTRFTSSGRAPCRRTDRCSTSYAT